MNSLNHSAKTQSPRKREAPQINPRNIITFFTEMRKFTFFTRTFLCDIIGIGFAFWNEVRYRTPIKRNEI